MSPSRNRRSLLPVTTFAIVIVMTLVETRNGQVQCAVSSKRPHAAECADCTVATAGVASRDRRNTRDTHRTGDRTGEAQKPRTDGRRTAAGSGYNTRTDRSGGIAPGFPVRVTDLQGYARGAVVVDSTRLDPNALGLFLPSAIPVKGEAFHGLGERAAVQGQGSSFGFSWLADLGAESVTGAAKAQVETTQSGELTVSAPQAHLTWKNMLFGLTDSGVYRHFRDP